MLIDPGIRRSGDAVIVILSSGIGTPPFNHGCALIAARPSFMTLVHNAWQVMRDAGSLIWVQTSDQLHHRIHLPIAALQVLSSPTASRTTDHVVDPESGAVLPRRERRIRGRNDHELDADKRQGDAQQSNVLGLDGSQH